jgi:hypothetical protein
MAHYGLPMLISLCPSAEHGYRLNVSSNLSSHDRHQRLYEGQAGSAQVGSVLAGAVLWSRTVFNVAYSL